MWVVMVYVQCVRILVVAEENNSNAQTYLEVDMCMYISIKQYIGTYIYIYIYTHKHVCLPTYLLTCIHKKRTSVYVYLSK